VLKETLGAGRRVTILYPADGPKGTDLEFEVLSLGFKGFYAAGPVADGQPKSRNGVRERDLVQIWTDPGGLRTLALDDIIKVK
jgi:hypothetical protein